MEYSHLRDILQGPILGLKDHGTHEQLPNLCKKLGLPSPKTEGTKRERLMASYDAVHDNNLPDVAKNYLFFFNPPAKLRNEIQDILWANEYSPPIPKRYRRELAQRLSVDDLYINKQAFDDLLDQIWIIDDELDILTAMLLTPRSDGLRSQITRYIHSKTGDWSVDDLFERLGVYKASDRRFTLFLEGLASHNVRPDIGKQRHFVQLINETLQQCGVEIREVGTDEGYPLFKLTPLTHATSNSPKNLIFASQVKPDIRFRDAINNDIEIVANADNVLVYDRQISNDGLRWKDLQDWWADRNGISDEKQAKVSLYNRLLKSLPKNSPPQILFFKTYFEHFGKNIPLLPALLPEVWLHWDPKTVKERGTDALLRFRMDFLMLLPNNSRIVLEIDGQHHYADDNGKANPSNYAAMMAADRDLRLAGYDVYRFGATELVDDPGRALVSAFFDKLFKCYHIN